MSVEIPDDLAKGLYEQLLTPTKDKDENVVYSISLHLAGDLRMAIAKGLEGK